MSQHDPTACHSMIPVFECGRGVTKGGKQPQTHLWSRALFAAPGLLAAAAARQLGSSCQSLAGIQRQPHPRPRLPHKPWRALQVGCAGSRPATCRLPPSLLHAHLADLHIGMTDVGSLQGEILVLCSVMIEGTHFEIKP